MGIFTASLSWSQVPPPSEQEEEKEQEEKKPAEEEDPSKLLGFREEVLVTAQKREETVADIPASVTVVTGQFLEQQRADDFQDLVPLVPGLSVTSTRPGVTRVTLRGVNTEGVASTIGVYFDDVPFGSSSGLANASVAAGDFDTFDMARVEVLRGPQGTLYGASSIGGVLKYVPNQPNFQLFEARLLGSAEAVANGSPGYSLTGMVNAPVSDKFAIRASGFYRFDSGFIDSIGGNPIPSLTNPAINVIDGTRIVDGLNSADRFGGRIAAFFKASDKVSINVATMLQNVESDGSSAVDADPASLEPLNSSPVQSRYQTEFNDTKYRVYSGTIDWNFGPASLESITSYGKYEVDFQTDLALATALTGGPPLSSLVTLLFGNAETRPLSAVLPQTTSTGKFTQELRLVSPQSESFEWLGGLYYTDEDSAIKQKISAVDAGTDSIAAGVPLLADVSLESTYEEWALFGNATWHVTPIFDLSFGARGSNNDQIASQVSDGPLVGGSTTFDDTKSSESPFTYSVAPRFELNEHSSIYGRIATGFRPGGPNVLPPGAPPDIPRTYSSDTMTSYEAGLKMTGSDGKFSLDLAVFYLDWEDIQLLAVVNNFGINGNGGTAVSRGLEFAAGVFPTSGLTLSLNGAYTNAELTQDTDPVVGGLDGDPLPYVPEWSFGLNADYEWTVMGDSRAYVGGSLGYTGDRTIEFGNRQADGSLRHAESFTTLNVRAGLFYSGRWSVEFYGKNLTNEMGVTEIGAAGFLPNGALGLSLIRPRTIGVSIGTRFFGS
jgi:outer membrane receptor protein involved in Fe transport